MVQTLSVKRLLHKLLFIDNSEVMCSKKISRVAKAIYTVVDKKYNSRYIQYSLPESSQLDCECASSGKSYFRHSLQPQSWLDKHGSVTWQLATM